nr:hypothetical protein [Clostridia bacterium]
GSPTSYILQDGKAVLSATTEGTREALSYIRDLIASGVMDPDLMALKDYNQANEKLYQNQAGFAFRSWATFVKPPFDEQLAQLTPEAVWVQIPTFAGEDGAQGYMMPTNVPGPVQSGYVLGEHLAQDEAKLARVLKYLDYIALGEGLDLVCYGIEGTHFTRDEQGALHINTELLAQTENGYQHQICGRIERDYLFGKFPTLHEKISFAASQP